MAVSGAPAHYPFVNLAALAVMSAWIAFGRGPHTATSRAILFIACMAFLVSARLIGPGVEAIGGERVWRWFPLGPVALNSGLIAIPPLVALAARDSKSGPFYLLAALAAVYWQPDAAAGFGLTFAAVGIYHVTRQWLFGLVAALGFFASLVMAVRGELPPQPFVERVLVDAAMQSVFLAIALALSMAAGFWLTLFAVPLSRHKRFALAGALFGFAIMAVMNSYPMPLVGYGPSAIIGFGIALGLYRIPQR